METQVLAPLPENHRDATHQLSPVAHRPEGRHRAAKGRLGHRAMRAAKYVLGRGHAPKRAAAPAAMAEQTQVIPQQAGRRTAPAHAEYQVPVIPGRTAEELRPVAPRLRYYQGQHERLGAGGNAVAVTAHLPLLAREHVKDQLGFDMGALRAVLHLPGTENPLYCFDKTTVDDKGDVLPRFAFATPQQLDQIRSMYETGSPSWDEIHSGMLFMSREPDEQGKMRNIQTIGRTRWVPGQQPGVQHEKPLDVPEYAHLANRQTRMRIDETGVLMIHDLAEAAHPTTVEVSPHLVPQQDPWPGAPMVPEHVVTNLHYNGPGAP